MNIRKQEDYLCLWYLHHSTRQIFEKPGQMWNESKDKTVKCNLNYPDTKGTRHSVRIKWAFRKKKKKKKERKNVTDTDFIDLETKRLFTRKLSWIS